MQHVVMMRLGGCTLKQGTLEARLGLHKDDVR